MSRRGFTLIEMMIVLSMLGIAAGATWGQLDTLQRATAIQSAREALVRALDNDVEAAITCPDRACLRAWAQGLGPTPDGASWSRAPIQRRLAGGPGGTTRVTVSADQPGLGERRVEVSRLLWVAR